MSKDDILEAIGNMTVFGSLSTTTKNK